MAHLIEMKNFIDARGELGVAGNKLPFDVKRAYFIWPATNTEARGKHRHHVTRQILFCTTGFCSVRILKHGKESLFHLKERSAGLLLEPEDWHEMFAFSEHCALTVLASHEFDANDYIDEPLP